MLIKMLAASVSSILQKAASSCKSINYTRSKGFKSAQLAILSQYLKKVFCLRPVIKLKEKVGMSTLSKTV